MAECGRVRGVGIRPHSHEIAGGLLLQGNAYFALYATYGDTAMSEFLPTTKREVEERGWDALDVIIISGDAYVDHPAFGHAVVARLIEAEGYRVAIVPQPNWRDDLRDFKKLGAPRLFWHILRLYGPDGQSLHRRQEKAFNRRLYAGGEAGFRPDYAATVYAQILKDLYPETPVVIGGIEGSLRRVTHYDYWSDGLKPSILAESGADLLIYGMGEQPLREILRLLNRGVPFSSLKTIPQTAFLQPAASPPPKNKQWESFELASHEQCLRDKKAFARNFKYIEQESNKQFGRRLLQRVGEQLLVVNPPYQTMREAEVDASFDLPYVRQPHPKYKKRGAIPAFEMIKFSVNMHRGCFGGCKLLHDIGTSG